MWNWDCSDQYCDRYLYEKMPFWLLVIPLCSTLQCVWSLWVWAHVLILECYFHMSTLMNVIENDHKYLHCVSMVSRFLCIWSVLYLFIGYTTRCWSSSWMCLLMIMCPVFYCDRVWSEGLMSIHTVLCGCLSTHGKSVPIGYVCGLQDVRRLNIQRGKSHCKQLLQSSDRKVRPLTLHV